MALFSVHPQRPRLRKLGVGGCNEPLTHLSISYPLLKSRRCFDFLYVPATEKKKAATFFRYSKTINNPFIPILLPVKNCIRKKVNRSGGGGVFLIKKDGASLRLIYQLRSSCHITALPSSILNSTSRLKAVTCAVETSLQNISSFSIVNPVPLRFTGEVTT